MTIDSRKRPMSSEDFLKIAGRISKYVDFRGCETEKSINNRIRKKNSPKLNNLIEASAGGLNNSGIQVVLFGRTVSIFFE